MTDVLVRPAEAGDAARLVQLGMEVGSEPEGWLISGGWRGVGHERRYLRAVRRSRDGAVFVAETREGIVGRLSVARDAHPACRHVADLGLMVAATHRRRGVGSALLDAAVAWAEKSGVKKLELHVFPHNKAAIALYEKYGFRREGYREAHYKREDGHVDAILMAYFVESARRSLRGEQSAT